MSWRCLCHCPVVPLAPLQRSHCVTMPPAWHCAHSPPAAAQEPLAASSITFILQTLCVYMCKTGRGGKGTGWARSLHDTLPTPPGCWDGGHPRDTCLAPATPRWGPGSPPPPGTHRYPTSGLPKSHTHCAPPKHSLGSEGVRGGQASTPAGFGGVLASQRLLLILFQAGQGGGAGGAPQPLQLLAMRLQHQLRQPREGLEDRVGG